MSTSTRPKLVVIGNGMVGHKLVELLIEDGGAAAWDLEVFGAEPRLAYDRVHLSEFFGGKSAAELSLVKEGYYARHGVTAHVGDPVEAIDRAARQLRTRSGRLVPYDRLVLATGSYPFVPDIPGNDGPGRFVYRTIEDLEAIRDFARGCRRGVVVGGGLLGLEAARALEMMGLETHVVEFAPHLMALQVDQPAGALLRNAIEKLGVRVHTSKNTVEIVGGADRVERLRFADGDELATDMVVFSAGIRPQDELARRAGLPTGPRGGVEIDDRCRTADPHIHAIGECAAWGGRTFGLVGPGYAMARVVAAHLGGSDDEVLSSPDLSTKLKLLGVDVASFGDAHGATEGARSVAVIDGVNGIYKKIVVSEDGKRLLGGILVGDAGDYGGLHQVMQNGIPLPARPEELILGAPGGGAASLGGADQLPDAAQVCSCNNVCKGALCAAIRAGTTALGDLKAATRAGTGCGGCVPLVTDILAHELAAQGIAISNHLCEHFAHSRQDLYHIVRVKGLRTFEALLAECGRGLGCEICKPAVASILAACWNEHLLEEVHAGLQDTNDQFLANMQRDGTYSVVPRVPGGEITPDKLVAIGLVARKYDLYTKITGGQRIDLFGAKLHELPAIWRELIAAGFESGHAYGKAVRTVKTCVGSTWCRYGVQDSVGLGIRLELRYRGLRAPHKLKLAVSGCIRECAEAQSKDVGVIATEQGYNLYVCGNGGARPRHADLLATDLDEATLVKYVDRFLMFYIRSADRLQRTARWLEHLEGGLAYLRAVVIEDRLGLCAELEQQMDYLVGSYRCEWKATVEDPAKLARFSTFVNADGEDDELVYVRERDQRRPAYPHERVSLPVVEDRT
jgi:nitrite reductase (NADH) large subunit